MSTFNVDAEVDKIVDSLTTDLRSRLKKLIMRSEKLVLRQYIASQKETVRVTKGTRSTRKKTKSSSVRTHCRERDYQYQELSSSGDES